MQVINLRTCCVMLALSGMSFLGGCSGNSNKSSAPSAPATSMVSADETPDPMKDKGIGPVASVTLGPVDQAMVADGMKIYESKCTACHNPYKKLIGPPQKGILDRRTPEWTMNMILNTQEMLEKDPVAKNLLKEFGNVAMTNPGLSQDDARKVLEYIRSL